MARQFYSMFVGRIPNDTTEEELIRVFSECGEVKGVGIVPNHEMPYGYGFVRFAKVETVLKAVQEMGHWTLRGKMLNVEIAKSTKDFLRQKSSVENLSIKTVTKDNGDRARVKEACFIINKELDLISGDEPIDVVHLLTSLERKPAAFAPKLKGNACEGTCLTQASLFNSIGAFLGEAPLVKKQKQQKLSIYLSNLQSDLEIIRSSVVKKKKDTDIQKEQDRTELNTGVNHTMNTSPSPAKEAMVGLSVNSLKPDAKSPKSNQIDNDEILKKNGAKNRNAEKETQVEDINSDCNFNRHNLSESVNNSVKSHVCGEWGAAESRCSHHSDMSCQHQHRYVPGLPASGSCQRGNTDNVMDNFKNMLCMSVLGMLGLPGVQDGHLGSNMLHSSQNNRMDISQLLGLRFGGPPETASPSHHDHNHVCDCGHKSSPFHHQQSSPFQHQQKQFSPPALQNFPHVTGMECLCCNNRCPEDHRESAVPVCSSSQCSSHKMSHSPCTQPCCRDTGKMGSYNKLVHASYEQCHSNHKGNQCRQDVSSPLPSVADKFCSTGCRHNSRSPDCDLVPMNARKWNTSGFSSQISRGPSPGCGPSPGPPLAVGINGPAQTSANKLAQFCRQKTSVSDEISNHHMMHTSRLRNTLHSFNDQNSGVAELHSKGDSAHAWHTQSNGYSAVRCKEPVSLVMKHSELVKSACPIPPRSLTETPPCTIDPSVPPAHSSFSPIDSPMKTSFDKSAGTDACHRPCLFPIVRKAARPYFNGPAHLLNTFNVGKTADESVSSSDTPKSSSSSGQGEDILSERDLSGKSSCDDEADGMEMQDYQEKARLNLLNKLQAEFEESDEGTQDSDHLWYMYGKASIKLRDCGSPDDKSSDSGISIDTQIPPLPAVTSNYFQGAQLKAYSKSAMSQKSDSDKGRKIGDSYIRTKLPHSSTAMDGCSKIQDSFSQTKLPHSSPAIGSQIKEGGRGHGNAFSSHTTLQKSLVREQMLVGSRAACTLPVRGRGKAILDSLKSQ